MHFNPLRNRVPYSKAGSPFSLFCYTTLKFWRRFAVLSVCLCLSLMMSGCGNSSTGHSGVLKTTPGTLSTSIPGAPTYAAIGASDTFGVGADDPYTENWPTDLDTLFNNSYHLVNLGIPGMTVHGALSAELPIALDQHPSLVTIWLAVNDLDDNVSATDYGTDLDTLLQRLRTALPDTKIVIGNVPDLTVLPAFSRSDKTAITQQVDAYNSIISSEAQKFHILLADLHAQALEPAYISQDGFHPNAQGYRVLAQVFYQVIKANT